MFLYKEKYREMAGNFEKSRKNCQVTFTFFPKRVWRFGQLSLPENDFTFRLFNHHAYLQLSGNFTKCVREIRLMWGNFIIFNFQGILPNVSGKSDLCQEISLSSIVREFFQNVNVGNQTNARKFIFLNLCQPCNNAN